MSDQKQIVNSPWKTAQEAALYLRLKGKFAYKTVVLWAKAGRLQAGRSGDHWLFNENDLDAFVRRGGAKKRTGAL